MTAHDILEGGWIPVDLVKAAEHYGFMCRFKKGKDYVVVHEFRGTVGGHFSEKEHRFFIGSPGAETPITEREYRMIEEKCVGKQEKPQGVPFPGDLRDYFAGQVLGGCFADGTDRPGETKEILTRSCYDMADEMLKAREQQAEEE